MSEFYNGNQPQGAPIPPMQPPMAPMPPQGGKGMAIASMVLGIVSLVFFCVWYISAVAAIVGLVLGIISLRGDKLGRGMAVAGIVTSAIGLALMILFLILAAAGLAILSSSTEWQNYLWQYS